MTGNPSIVESPIDAFDQRPPDTGSDPTIFSAVNTFFATLKVSDALLRISRTISDRRRRAAENGSPERWWPVLNRELHDKHIVPLMDELTAFQPKHGYEHDAVMAALRETSAILIHAPDETPLPAIKTDGQLIEDFLEPALAKLRDSIGAGKRDARQHELLSEISQRAPREWFKSGSGHGLVSCLENLVSSEPRSAPHRSVTDDPSLFGMPGMVVEVSREEAEPWGFVEDDAISEEDAWESQADLNSYSRFRLTDQKLGWYECDTAAKAVLLAASVAQQRIEARAHPRKQDGTSRRDYFCELCDELTEAMSKDHERWTKITPSEQFCKAHATARGRTASGHSRELHWLVSTMLQEARKDSDYRRRFVARAHEGELQAEVAAHTDTCLFCSGRSMQSKCLDPSIRYFPALIAFHANVRKAAYKIANSHHAGVAIYIDEAVRRGECPKETARFYRLRSDKAVGQHSGLAIARLLHKRVNSVEIASRFGISPSAVSQRRTALTGSFDFSPKRHLALIWWPFDDIGGPDVLKFPARALGTEWRHSADEYEHLSSNRKANLDHRRLASSSSLFTKSSARRCV